MLLNLVFHLFIPTQARFKFPIVWTYTRTKKELDIVKNLNLIQENNLIAIIFFHSDLLIDESKIGLTLKH